MDLDRALQDSDALAAELLELIDLPLFDDTPRLQVADTACSLAIEHWHSVRIQLTAGLLPSALVVHRAQFEAIVRSIWLTYCASEMEVNKLTATLNLESEQAAKNISQTQSMMEAIATSAPPQAHAALARFKDNSWKSLNSYAHAGIHPLRRHADGYPAALAHSVLCNANGLGLFCGMQAVVLSGLQPLQRLVLDLGAKYPSCMPPPRGLTPRSTTGPATAATVWPLQAIVKLSFRGQPASASAVGLARTLGSTGTTMANLRVAEVKAFVPARDFELSKRFYQDLGFTMASEGGGVAYFHRDQSSFLLQDFCVDDHIKNFMMHLLVESVDDWHQQITESGLADKYKVEVGPVELQPWRMRDFTLLDPSGVLWRIAENVK